MQKEGSWKEAVEIYSMQDKSRQEEFKAAQAERNLEIERLKRGALEENLRHQKGTFVLRSHLFKINKNMFLFFFLTFI